MQKFRQLLEAKFAEACKADPLDAPMFCDEVQAVSYHRIRRDLMQWVIEMLPSDEKPAAANDNPAPAYTHAAAINIFAADCHARSRKAGWYTDLATGKALDRNVPEMLCLIHSEISEAMEGFRKNLQDDKLPHRKMMEVELADAMIRIGDLATFLGYDLGGAIVEKMAYNDNREDHKIENRLKAGGKGF